MGGEPYWVPWRAGGFFVSLLFSLNTIAAGLAFVKSFSSGYAEAMSEHDDFSQPELFAGPPVAPDFEWPIYYRDSLIVGDPTQGIGVVTLWTQRQQMAEALPLSKVAAVGQLYSHNKGISAIIRNILANPVITELVLCGADKSGSGKALEQFFAKGVDENNCIIGINGGQLDRELPKTALDQVRKKVSLVNLRNEISPQKVGAAISERTPNTTPWASPQLFPLPDQTPPETLPSEKTNFVVRGKRVVDVWPRVLATVMDFGTVKRSQHSDDQREVINLIVETNESPDRPSVPSWLGFTQAELDDYYPQVVSANEIPGINYTYGQRLFTHRGIDQIQNMIDQLKEEPWTRRAVAVTWDVVTDARNSHAPCLDLVQALVENDTLYLTAYIRSNDMYEAWPRNNFALRRLQQMIATGAGLSMGTLTTVSNSAHIYAARWNEASAVVEKRGRVGTHTWSEAKQQCLWNQADNDPRGVMVISIKEGEIYVIHQDWQSGETLHIWHANSAVGIYSQMVAHGAVSMVGHAFDIGCELQKAELALQGVGQYQQDKPLIV